MAKGRKRKHGKRTKSGQLSRAGQRAKPSQWVQGQLERFGNHYGSALGRAYATGLLGEGVDGKARYDAGRKFAQRYTRTFGIGGYACPLGDNDGGGESHDPERDRHQQEWLFKVMDRLDVEGVRPYLDQLLSTVNTDDGPYWLNNLMAGGDHTSDKKVLNAAITALDIIGGTEGDSTMSKAKTNVDIPLHRCYGRI